PDALIETPWGPRRAGADGVAQIAGDGAPFQAQIEHPGHTPAIVTVDGPETAAPLRPAREVEVRCAGFVMDRCPFVPDLVVGEATLPCRWLPRFGVVCDVPVDTPARVGAAGVWQEIPAAPPGLGDPVELDYRVFTGGVTGRAPQQDGEPTACSVLAIREVGWVEAILDGWLDRPRVRAARRTCDPDGTFDLGPLSPGAWRVRVDLLPGPVVERTVVVGDARVPIDLGG
ncbi:MAG TPA: hypothetical protein PKA64_08585, partial [Myxococcota bacterium]|nr:hypothetical protein [Myxococcota bacterium]